MTTWLPLMEMARRFGRAESTVRAWRDRHARYIPERIDDDGRRTYPLELMRAILAMKDRRLRVDQIDAELERRQGTEGGPPEPEPDSLLSVLREIRDDLRAIRRAVERNAGADDGPHGEGGD